MKRTVGWVLIGWVSLSLATPMVVVADDQAKKPNDRAGERPGLEGRPGFEGKRPQRGEGFQRPGFAGNPEQAATMMIRQFDTDGDEKLDVKELAAMMTAMRERGAAMMGRGGANPGGEGAPARMREMMENRRRGMAEGADQPGGVRPKRPPMDQPAKPAEANDAT